ncbi:MAG: hypothetical protein ACOZAA_00465, partial [Pseudomonadota bacterium]
MRTKIGARKRRTDSHYGRQSHRHYAPPICHCFNLGFFSFAGNAPESGSTTLDDTLWPLTSLERPRFHSSSCATGELGYVFFEAL